MKKATTVTANAAKKSVNLQLSELKKEVDQLKNKLKKPRMITLTIRPENVYAHLRRLCQGVNTTAPFQVSEKN